ncbi:baseplate hub subunit and tail lysozyme [Vibrio phage PWH3a-P1]|uniref:baseplate hub subunit and tail lysozyme n=1 Tax=Vibrio phage PWH3a-P1 TaxID=754058 RepID=UPI0002C04FC8|nr:baseplate hub subunit and tail lysozyme [Vibrio phage PWH3a-P1]AGH31953.1 hypothetical protein VPIG_00095 [Vibrio phage PWH3a-P1]
MTLIRKGNRGVVVRKLQERLVKLGYNTNGVDGVFGQGTFEAVKQFQKDQGLNPDGIVGENTKTSLEQSTTINEIVVSKTLPWIQEAYKDLGVHEVKDEDKVHQMWKDCKLSGLAKFSASKIPWCSGAACAWMERAGIKSPRTDGAKNWLGWGVELEEPAYGSVAVFTRQGGAHVGFVVGEDYNGNLLIVGGNQSNEVNVKSFAKSRVSGYRFPTGYTPNYVLPVGDATELSNNEA